MGPHGKKSPRPFSICALKDWRQKRPGSKATLPQKLVSMNLVSSAVLTGCYFVSILQKTPKDVADDTGHRNIAELLGGDAVLIVSRYTVRILLLLS